MKHGKILSLFAAALLGLSAAAFPPSFLEEVSISANAAVSGDWQYSYNTTNGVTCVTIDKYLGTSQLPVIPDETNGKTVTKIGNRAFQKKTGSSSYSGMNITGIYISRSITEIGEFAFALSSLGQVYIPSCVQTIKRGAFWNCTSLTKVETQAAVTIEKDAFKGCTALTNAKLHQDCTAEENAFTNCTALSKLKGYVMLTTDSSGKPILRNVSSVRKLVRNIFTKSSNVKFVDDYCTAICNYIAATETRPWMCEAAKARQLFRWLCDNCHYETDNTTFYEPENQLYSSVFLSYALDGEGETVCTGYSKAYKMLLSAAGIEAYLVSSDLNDYGLTQIDLEYWGIAPGSRGGHMWNMIKADGAYYQCDASAADTDADQSRRYQYFLQTDFSMFNMHNNYYNSTQLATVSSLENHPYLSCNTSTGQAALNQCVYSYSDANYDGILDCDFNFDGIANTWIDNYILSRIAAGDMNLNGTANEAEDLVLAQIFSQLPYHDTWLNMCIWMFPHTFGSRN